MSTELEFKERDYKIGLCFKIYADETTSDERYNIILDFVKSLNSVVHGASAEHLCVVGVIDCIPNEKLKMVMSKLDKSIEILTLNENKGISFATNIGFEHLMNNSCDYLFSCDDDIVFKKPEVFKIYINAMIKNKMCHLACYPFFHNKRQRAYKLSGRRARALAPTKLLKSLGYSGCFYSITRQAILLHGYLPCLEGTYGYEHEALTKITTGDSYDVVNSDVYLELNKKSLLNTSGKRIENKKPEYYRLEPFVSSKHYRTLATNAELIKSEE